MGMKDQRKIVMLASGEGSTVKAFVEKSNQDSQFGKVVAILTDKEEAGVVSLAKENKIHYHIVRYNAEDKELWDLVLLKKIQMYEPHLILLAGFLRKIGPSVLQAFPQCILNSHPSLLPEFSGKGMYGLKVHEAVLAAQRKETGVTIHVVNEEYDRGRILAQEKIAVLKTEKPLELEKRVKILEKKLYIQTVEKILAKQILL